MWAACWPPVWTGLPSQRPCSRHRSMATGTILRFNGEIDIVVAMRIDDGLFPAIWDSFSGFRTPP